MTRKGDTILAASLKRFAKKLKKQVEQSLANELTMDIVVDDARDSSGKAGGSVAIEIEINKPSGWGDDNIIEIHGNVGLDSSGKRGKKEDEAYLDGVTVGNWEEGSKAIDLNRCSVGEFLVHLFALFAIKAGNLSLLLDNAAGEQGEHIYKKVGFIKSKGERAMYGEDNEMIVSLTGKKKNKDAGQLWRERYNKFRKKITTKIKNSAKCKKFWKKTPPIMEAPGPMHMMARGSRRRTRKKRGGAEFKVGDIIWKTVLVNDPNRPNIPIERRYYKIMDIDGFNVGREGELINYILLRRVKQNGEPWLPHDRHLPELGSTGGTDNELDGDEVWRYLDQFWERSSVAKRSYKLFNKAGTGATQSGGGRKTRVEKKVDWE